MNPFRNNLEMRPGKRRRVEMDTPEGFLATANLPPKVVHKPTVPSFSSAFDDQVSSRKGPAHNDHASKKPSSHRLREVFDPAAMKENMSGRVDASDNSTPKPRKVVSMKDVCNEITLDSPAKHLAQPQLRPAPRVPPPPPAAGSSTSKLPLKRITTPAFPFAKPSSKVLMPIQPLPNVIANTTRNTLAAGNELRTISTTRLGRFVDLSSENGVDEIASILLRDQHPELHTADGAPESHTLRGLELSPDKKGKGSASKLTRGGLAARVSMHFDRTRTAFILWQRQKEMELQRANAPPHGADICATVAKVLHGPLSPTNKHSLPVITLCHVRQPNGTAHTLFKVDHLYRVVFSSLDIRTKNSELEELAEGHIVRIFKPWNEMPYSHSKDNGTVGIAPRLPASLPLPSSAPFSTPDPLDAPINDTILFCSRFFIS